MSLCPKLFFLEANGFTISGMQTYDDFYLACGLLFSLQAGDGAFFGG